MGLFELLQKVVSVLERLGIPYLITDSVAAGAWIGTTSQNGQNIWT